MPCFSYPFHSWTPRLAALPFHCIPNCDSLLPNHTRPCCSFAPLCLASECFPLTMLFHRLTAQLYAIAHISYSNATLRNTLLSFLFNAVTIHSSAIQSHYLSRTCCPNALPCITFAVPVTTELSRNLEWLFPDRDLPNYAKAIIDYELHRLY